MKKILFTLITLLCTLSICAQEEHLKFMGVPIHGSLDGFYYSMIGEGFEKLSKSEDSVLMRGKFADLDCTLFLSGDQTAFFIYSVSVHFYNIDTLDSLINEYNRIINLYELKYGEPTIYDKAQKDKKCTTAWGFKEGEIAISLNPIEKNLAVYYFDSINHKKHKLLESL